MIIDINLNQTSLASRFHENGQLRSKGQLNEGEQVGYWEWYGEEGNLIETKKFQ